MRWFLECLIQILGRAGRMGGSFDTRNPGEFRQTGNSVIEFRPALPAISSELDIPVVGSHPDHSRFQWRFRNRQDRAVEFGSRVVLVDGASRGALLSLVIGRQIGTDFFPAIALITTFEEHIPPEVNDIRVVRRNPNRRIPVEAIPVVFYCISR